MKAKKLAVILGVLALGVTSIASCGSVKEQLSIPPVNEETATTDNPPKAEPGTPSALPAEAWVEAVCVAGTQVVKATGDLDALEISEGDTGPQQAAKVQILLTNTASWYTRAADVFKIPLEPRFVGYNQLQVYKHETATWNANWYTALATRITELPADEAVSLYWLATKEADRQLDSMDTMKLYPQPLPKLPPTDIYETEAWERELAELDLYFEANVNCGEEFSRLGAPRVLFQEGLY